MNQFQAKGLYAPGPFDVDLESELLRALRPRLMVTAVCLTMISELGVRFPTGHMVGDVFSHMPLSTLHRPGRLPGPVFGKSLAPCGGRGQGARCVRGKRRLGLR